MKARNEEVYTYYTHTYFAIHQTNIASKLDKQVEEHKVTKLEKETGNWFHSDTKANLLEHIVAIKEEENTRNNDFTCGLHQLQHLQTK